MFFETVQVQDSSTSQLVHHQQLQRLPPLQRSQQLSTRVHSTEIVPLNVPYPFSIFMVLQTPSRHTMVDDHTVLHKSVLTISDKIGHHAMVVTVNRQFLIYRKEQILDNWLKFKRGTRTVKQVVLLLDIRSLKGNIHGLVRHYQQNAMAQERMIVPLLCLMLHGKLSFHFSIDTHCIKEIRLI